MKNPKILAAVVAAKAFIIETIKNPDSHCYFTIMHFFYVNLLNKIYGCIGSGCKLKSSRVMNASELLISLGG